MELQATLRTMADAIAHSARAIGGTEEAYVVFAGRARSVVRVTLINGQSFLLSITESDVSPK